MVAFDRHVELLCLACGPCPQQERGWECWVNTNIPIDISQRLLVLTAAVIELPEFERNIIFITQGFSQAQIALGFVPLARPAVKSPPGDKQRWLDRTFLNDRIQLRDRTVITCVRLNGPT